MKSKEAIIQEMLIAAYELEAGNPNEGTRTMLESKVATLADVLGDDMPREHAERIWRIV